MTSMRWVVRCATPFLFALSAHAATQGEQLVQSLLECSPKYFAQVRGTADFSSAGYTFNPKGRLIVPNARDELGSGYRVMGKRSIELGGLTVVGMYDLHRKANTFEMFDWGLLVKGDPASLTQKLNSRLSADRSLESDGILGFARLESTTIKTWPKWVVRKPLPPRGPVEFGDLEMVAEITVADEELPGVSRIGCSLQGVFPPFVLQQRRPDID
ncbi:hypothetical protein AZ34_09165 [Hylemonella gracilis str. Niagara R]|uniref:Uncharacterized protein n=1 Tax=Hylemonella gracilis str. Niagara R TaxID=1458275 RepID=A0A016XLR3_9BURK|nr:hypothetical protein AZ34_09165 [Hylemonella gracilis str. Niagara R]